MLPNSEKQMREYLGQILQDARVQRLFKYVENDHENTVKEQCDIALIEAPPLFEDARAVDFARRFTELGLIGAHVDEHKNAVAMLPGSGKHGDLLIEAHLDTVFPFGTVKGIRMNEGRIEAPGICDNCRGLAAILCIIRAMSHAGIALKKDVTFAGTAGEEGIGDLKGMRGLFAFGQRKFDYSLSVDGHGKGDFVFDGTGSRRFEVLFETAGGHSWTDFGKPSAIHAMGRAISKIAAIGSADGPKTTYNVGLIKGGTSVNAIAQSASMTVDMRSESPEQLEKLEKTFMELVNCACDEEAKAASIKAEVKAPFRKVGDRPAGRQPEGSNMPMAASLSSELLGIKFERAGASSTNANIPISYGVPSLCMGAGGDGGGIHTVEEWFLPSDGWKAIQQCALLLIACAGLA